MRSRSEQHHHHLRICFSAHQFISSLPITSPSKHIHVFLPAPLQVYNQSTQRQCMQRSCFIFNSYPTDIRSCVFRQKYRLEIRSFLSALQTKSLSPDRPNSLGAAETRLQHKVLGFHQKARSLGSLSLSLLCGLGSALCGDLIGLLGNRLHDSLLLRRQVRSEGLVELWLGCLHLCYDG